MDNKVFNVNGVTVEQLTAALKLLLLDEYGKTRDVAGWYFSKKKGFVITWWVAKDYVAIPFTDRLGKPSPITADELVPILMYWLQGDEAKTVEMKGWDENADHDGSNDLGWRLYVEDWGHVHNDSGSLDHYTIGAFKPAYIWYGK